MATDPMQEAQDLADRLIASDWPEYRSLGRDLLDLIKQRQDDTEEG